MKSKRMIKTHPRWDLRLAMSLGWRPKDFIARTSALLLDPDEEWVDSYGIILDNRKRGIEVWVGNDAYGIHIEPSPDGSSTSGIRHYGFYLNREYLWTAAKARMSMGGSAFWDRALNSGEVVEEFLRATHKEER